MEANRLQVGINQRQVILGTARLDPDVERNVRSELFSLQGELTRLQPQLFEANERVAGMESRLQELLKKQLNIVLAADALTLEWLELCDLFGANGAEVHRGRLAVLGRWVAEVPDLWHVHLARGCSQLHAGEQQAAVNSFASAFAKIRDFDPRPPALAAVRMIEAYALNRNGEHKLADARAREAFKVDGKSAAIHVLRGQMLSERGQKVSGDRDLKMARQLADRHPAENELGVLLLRMLRTTEGGNEEVGR